MAYSKNSSISASDYNTFAGLTATAAASAAVAQNAAGYLWGVGYGDRGYGQTSPALTAVTAGSNITTTEWTNLRNTISSLASWQGTAQTLLPAASTFAVGQNVVAHERDSPSLNAYDLQDMLALVDTNRLNFTAASMGLATALTHTRVGTWSTTIACTMQAAFASENAARHYFNTGGQLRVALSHPDTSTTQDSAWNTMLSSLVVSMGAHSTVRTSGSVGSGSSIGYYELTSSFQNIFSGVNVGTGAYAANDVYVAARTVQTSYTNGGKGYQIQLRVTLNDDHTNANYDSVKAGTVATWQTYRATSTLTIAAPTVTSIAAWA